MDIPLSRPITQAGLTAVARVFDEVFAMVPPTTMFRVGFMNDLVRSDQLVLLAGTEDEPLGAIVALRARNHVELPDMVVAKAHQGRGVGARLFAALTQWTVDEGFDEIKWSVSPSNLGGVGAYLSYGARITGWIDNAYGVASDSFYTGTTDRFRGAWRASGWPETTQCQLVDRDDHKTLRALLLDGWQIEKRENDNYVVGLGATVSLMQ